MLTLPIKKKWFDMIKSGEKKEEYREIKPYWSKRLDSYIADIGNVKYQTLEDGCGAFLEVNDEILLRNGYGKDKPTIKCKVKVEKGYGKEEWGAIHPLKKYYVLKILKVEDYNE